jgi:nucleoside-diphosphate-sugar epimerase
LVGGEIFNVFHDNYQIRELAMLVAGSAIMRKYTVELKDAPLPEITRDYKCDNRKIRERIGFVPEISVLQSIETMLHAVEEAGAIDFAHPRYYNIAWMSLLEEAHRAMQGFNSVY